MNEEIFLATGKQIIAAAAVEQPNRRRRSEVEAEANRRAASSVALSIHPFWELGLVLTPEPFLEEVFSTSCLSSE